MTVRTAVRAPYERRANYGANYGANYERELSRELRDAPVWGWGWGSQGHYMRPHIAAVWVLAGLCQ